MGAIVEGHPEVVDLLLQYGARLDDVNEMGTTALTLALAYDPHVARKLIDAGASLRLPETDGGIPLVAAARLGLTDFVILIQERMGTRVRPSDLRLAHLEARNSGHSEITALLERQGVAPWPDGVSLFDRRLPFVPRDIEDCVAVLDRLLSEENRRILKTQGADIAHFSLGMWIRNNWRLWAGSRLSRYFEQSGLRHPEGQSSLILDTYVRYLRGEPSQFEEDLRKEAAQERQWEAEAAQAPPVVVEGHDSLAAAVAADRLDLVEARLPGATAAELRAALGESARAGNRVLLRRLLDAGADIHDRGLSGVPVLMIAAGRGHTAFIQDLVAAGADVCQVDTEGHTALDYAYGAETRRYIRSVGLKDSDRTATRVPLR